MKVFFLMSLFSVLFSLNLVSSEELVQRCFEPTDSDPVIYGNDLKWSQTLEEMKLFFEKIYNSDKRLYKRAYYDKETDEFYIPVAVPVLKTFKPVAMSRDFIRNITNHIETALKRKYADYIFFSDMGHSHFYFPEKLYKEKLLPFDDDKRDLLYKAFMEEPTLKVLYHTAEQLKMTHTLSSDAELIFDKHILWRYFSRNIVGDNLDGSTLEIYYTGDNEFNTVRELEGHDTWSSGFNFSANKNGCFPYKHNGETYYFDISFEDLPYNDSDFDDTDILFKIRPRL